MRAVFHLTDDGGGYRVDANVEGEYAVRQYLVDRGYIVIEIHGVAEAIEAIERLGFVVVDPDDTEGDA